MTLEEFFEEQSGPLCHARAALALKVGTSGEYLRLVASDYRRASPALAKKIVEATKGKVKLHEIRPDIWDAPKRRGTAQS
jgi:DNA-binding transcriptional regulator YdaS (Cro superfamily)